MRKSIVAAAVLLCAIACTQAFGQISNATVTGTIEDATHAVLPGVSITSTNTATGVTTTAVSNEAGTYNLPSLLPGPYKISAELAGFQIRSYDVTLGNAQTVRLNFTLAVAGVGTAVEVSVAVDTLLATSSASVGEVLTQDKVKDLPLVGNNALFLLNTLSGPEWTITASPEPLPACPITTSTCCATASMRAPQPDTCRRAFRQPPC